MRFNSKAYCFFVNKLCFPKNPAGYLVDRPPGLFLLATALIFDY